MAEGEGYKVTIAFLVMFTVIAIVAIVRPSEMASMIMAALISGFSTVMGVWYTSRGQTSDITK